MLVPQSEAAIDMPAAERARSVPEQTCVHEAIAAQARRTPHAVAVEFHDRRLSYSELDERSTRLANHLRRLGVTVESLVGVCLERSAEMVVALLGVMKAGGAYVPLDPGFPVDRLAYMLKDSGAHVLITGHDQLWRFMGYHGVVVDLEEDTQAIASESGVMQPSGVRADNLAYVIYTSGSTGTPKGVMIPHGAVMNFLQAMRTQPGLTQRDVVLAVTTLSFDIAALELYLPLTAGGRVVVADRETAADGRMLAAELTRRQVTLMQATPATWRMLIDSGWEGDKRLKALCGGEAMSRELAEVLLPRVDSLWNMYGPTETTVWSLTTRVEARSGSVPIGQPIANTTVYILDDHGRHAPTGVAGGLFIGGKGLARGYRNLPGLTAEKFIANPLPEGEGETIYDTGDMARYRPDGQVDFLGRLDSQVKVRGYRIELGEIEAVLRQHPAVREAIVAVRASHEDDKRLVAWMLPNGHAVPDADEVRQHARKLLPLYMVPAAFLFLDAYPTTPNGKVDRQALSVRDMVPRRVDRDAPAPQSPLETTLLRIFRELFSLNSARVTDDFFELGGHSLMAVRLVARIEKETGHSIPVATLFDAPTVQQLARKLEDRTYSSAWSPLVKLRAGSASAEPLFCIHWLDAKLITFQKIASLLRDDRPVYGLQPGGSDDLENPVRTIKEMAAVYLREIRACRPHGPYHLAGSCLGGVVAFEIAQQLVAEGEEPGLLLMIDASMPGGLEYLHERPYAVQYLDKYFGEFLLSPAAAIGRWLHESAARLAACCREGRSPSRTSDRLRKVSRDAAAGYRPKRYPGKVTLLMCSDGALRAYEDRRLAWNSVAEGGLEIHVVPGNHTSMEQEPNIRVIGERFQRCFDRLCGIPCAPVCEACGGAEIHREPSFESLMNQSSVTAAGSGGIGF